MDCLVCNKEIYLQLNWQILFTLQAEQILCETCKKQFDKISGTRCKICSRPFKEEVCPDCKGWNDHPQFKHALDFNLSIYTYNDFLSKVIANWKYRGDYILGTIFKEQFIRVFETSFTKLIKESIIVPIPLSENRLQERGFNQAKMLASFLTKKPYDILTRIDSEKQSKKSRYERLVTKNPFSLQEKINKPVILVDDIYTTGITLRHAGALLKGCGCPAVYAYTLIRS